MARDPDDFARGAPVDASFFEGQAREIAPDLLGMLLLNETPEGPVGGLIVEAEAYVNALDPACHLSAGRTPRTEPFFSGAETVYVFTIYGHHNLNFITEYDGFAEGTLLRALEPTHGRNVMRERRGVSDERKLTSGPGRLTEALGVTKADYDGKQLADTSLELYHTDVDPEVTVSSRVGVTAAENWPLRFTIADSPYVSQPVATGEELDYAAVEACYETLREGPRERLPTVEKDE